MSEIEATPLAAYIKGLSDPTAEVREEAVQALVALGSDAVIDTLSRLPRVGETWKSVARVLGLIGTPRAIDLLTDALNNSATDAFLVACLALADAGHAAAEPLRSGLHHPSAAVRSRCAMAVGRIALAEAIDDLLQVIQDSDWTVRLESILALAALKEDRAVPALIAALQDEEDAVRQTVPVALGEIGTAAAIQGLRGALLHDDPNLRWIAEWQLKELNVVEVPAD